MASNERICVGCGQPFTPKPHRYGGRPPDYCTPECRKTNKGSQRLCQICGTTFTLAYSAAGPVCPACRISRENKHYCRTCSIEVPDSVHGSRMYSFFCSPACQDAWATANPSPCIYKATPGSKPCRNIPALKGRDPDDPTVQIPNTALRYFHKVCDKHWLDFYGRDTRKKSDAARRTPEQHAEIVANSKKAKDYIAAADAAAAKTRSAKAKANK